MILVRRRLTVRDEITKWFPFLGHLGPPKRLRNGGLCYAEKVQEALQSLFKNERWDRGTETRDEKIKMERSERAFGAWFGGWSLPETRQTVEY